MKDKGSPWEIYPEIWKTKSAWLSWIRGGIRRSLWNRHPVKLNFIKHNRFKIPNPNPKGRVEKVWGGRCSISGEILPLKNLEVDHKTGNHSLREIHDIQPFIEGICFVTEDDLQFVSKEMHKVKSYSEKRGISFSEALAEKTAIKLIKEKKDKQWLKEHGIIPASNATKRREQIVDHLNKEK